MFEEYKKAFEKEEQRKKAQQSLGKISKVVFRWPSFISEKYQHFSAKHKSK